MGIKLAILPAADVQIGHFRKYPSELEDLLNRLIPAFSSDLCYLSSYWRPLHRFLTGGTGPAALPLGALTQGDLAFTRGLSDPTHALYAATTVKLAERLQAMKESRAAELAGEDEDTRGAFMGLLRTAECALSERKGLIFCRYEDW
jgi:hypothetical protein